MDRGVAVVLTAMVGGLIALQAPINSHLGKSIGTFQAAFVSFTIGTIVLAVIAGLAKGGMSTVPEARHLPWYYLTGGLLGVVFVSTLLVTVRPLGAAGILAATLVGQMAASVVIDRFGLFGLERTPITAARLAGIGLVALGAWIVTRS